MMTTDALHVRAIAKRMMTGAVVAGMAAGTAIQRATPRHRGAAGTSVAVRAAAIGMMMIAAVICLRGTTRAGSPARGRVTMTTMTIGAAAADTAAGTAIRKVTPKRHG